MANPDLPNNLPFAPTIPEIGIHDDVYAPDMNKMLAQLFSNDVTMKRIIDKGDANTVDGKHASDFAPAGYGLGTNYKILSNAEDLNGIRACGFYYVCNNNPNRPADWCPMVVVGDPSITNATGQQCFAPNGNVYVRSWSGLGWTAWKQMATTEIVPAGFVAYCTIPTPPAGWLKANGAAVSRTAYAALFAVIGTRYGAGDGSTTFNLPDLRGEFIRNWDDGRGVDAGRAFGSLQADAFRLHGHPVYYSREAGGSKDAAGAIAIDGSGPLEVHYGNTGGPGTVTSSLSTNAVGGSGGTETRPRNRALLACIKY